MTRQPIVEADLADLLDRVGRANEALLAGDARRYFELVRPADDLTLMTPFGGVTQGNVVSETQIAAFDRFFQGGAGRLELLGAHASGDLALLVLIERQRARIGGLADQDWSLRVTLVFRRDASGWRLLHRHADPLVRRIEVEAAAALARG